MRPHLVRDGAITLAVGLIFSTVGIEGLAAFNACVADPACLAYSSSLNLPAFFGLLIVGMGIAVAGAVVLVLGLSEGPRSWTDPLA